MHINTSPSDVLNLLDLLFKNIKLRNIIGCFNLHVGIFYIFTTLARWPDWCKPNARPSSVLTKVLYWLNLLISDPPVIYIFQSSGAHMIYPIRLDSRYLLLLPVCWSSSWSTSQATHGWKVVV
ncbi:hypothetical protein M758_4G060500 [Ceratodon purpureus]|uniref:Uncharacterized protein n=1 Tax=Ceratodon purpureus TaxID=3225 RepID=A0A8T0I727_CERPU|nr:hypothetical protein KC19_4G058000 [Ceratodon purpureus]KAG0618397.1 hypothetical protein M758_4G060500 [Ceratodon purpureus]